MTRDEEILAKVMQERGYLVLGFDHPRRIGDIEANGSKHGEFPGHPFVIVAQTDRADGEVQIRRLAELGMSDVLEIWDQPYFYRVSTD